MKVLVACEESQEVCKAFRALGHEAYSCDIQEPSGGHPEWHILGDALKAINSGIITTMDSVKHDIGKWDLLIAHTKHRTDGERWKGRYSFFEESLKRGMICCDGMKNLFRLQHFGLNRRGYGTTD